ncbi:MAG: hypothetical protein LBO66_13905 [Deltaproteobacteria bacterium]|jgi:hypothetical protein|nr:hypothetical protein [Deltaproteobacteria bacterium]
MSERPDKKYFGSPFNSVVGVDVHGKKNFARYYRPVSAGYVHERDEFSALPEGNRELVDWVIHKDAEGMIMESAGVYLEDPPEVSRQRWREGCRRQPQARQEHSR